MKQEKQIAALNFVLIQTVAILIIRLTSQKYSCFIKFCGKVAKSIKIRLHSFCAILYALQGFRGKFKLVMFHNVSI